MYVKSTFVTPENLPMSLGKLFMNIDGAMCSSKGYRACKDGLL